MKRMMLTALCWCCCIVLSYAQQNDQRLTISLLDESFALPSTNFIKTDINPGIAIGLERPFKFGAKHEFGLSYGLGYFYHQKLEHNIFAQAAIFYKYDITKRFHAQADFGLGYAHTFNPTELYEQQSDGSFNVVKQTGRAHAIATLGLELGYNLRNAQEKPLMIFTKYQMMLETPFAITIPVVPHTLFHVGVKFGL